MKKLLTLAVILAMAAATTSAQVTFTYEGGENCDNWNMNTSPQNVTIDGQIWRANPGPTDGKYSYVILKTSDNSKTHIQGYTITLASNSQTDGRLPYTWTLEGSNDKENWTLIHRQMQANRMAEDFDDPNTSTNNKSYTYYCNTKNNTPYTYFKLTVTGKTRGSWGCFEIASLNLIPSNVGFSGSGNGMDGDTNTKQEGNSFPQTITVTGSASTRITGFQFTTGNDNADWPGRNPRTIKVEGSSDNTNWTQLLLLENYTGMEDKNYYPYVFDIDGNQSYLYYKFSFSDVTAQWNYFQVSEIALITPLEPLQISTPADLTNFALLVNNGSTSVDAVLTDDIDMSGVTGWWPIGGTDDSNDGNNGNKAYKGTFDGKNHTIDNLVQDNNGNNNQGLFGVVNGGCVIKNLILGSGCQFKGAKFVGAFVGSSRGSGWVTIQNCGNEGAVTASGNNAAAFIGCVVGGGPATRITDCYNRGNISGNAESAILTGWFGGHNSVNVNNFYNTGSITGCGDGNPLYRNNQNFTFNNVYHTSAEQGATKIEEGWLTSGELCYKLGESFKQDLSQESYPIPFGTKAVSAGKWFNDTDNDVYYNLEDDNYTVYKIDMNESQTAYNVPNNVTVKNFSFSRTYIADQWIGMCIPVSIMCPTDWDARELNSVNGNGENATMMFSETNTLWAGKPYLIKPNSSVYLTLTLGNAQIISAEEAESQNTQSINGINMIGNLHQTNITTGDFYINTSSQLKKLTAASATLKGFRAYFTVDGSSNVKALSFDFDDDATSIEMVNDQSSMVNDQPIYNLAGQRLGKMQKGINIVNGKKILF